MSSCTASSVPSSGGSLLDFDRRRGGTRVRGFATVYLGLGSNVGDRHANLLRAYKGLREVRNEATRARCSLVVIVGC